VALIGKKNENVLGGDQRRFLQGKQVRTGLRGEDGKKKITNRV